MSVDLARALVASERPDLGGREIVLLGEGWDNWSYRLGDELLIRLPRRSIAAPLIENEWNWLGQLAPRLPLRVPVPVHLGEPSHGYPFRWAIYPYLQGQPASSVLPSDMSEAAEEVARFLTALHRPAPTEAPSNPFRGVALSERGGPTGERIDVLRSEEFPHADELQRVWEHALDVPDHDGAPVWLHGDFHPHNLLVDDGDLVAVVDWGDITSGDPAVDLSVGWMMFSADNRARLRSAYGDVPDDLWDRARGWALSLGLAMMLTSEDKPVMGRIGRKAVEEVLDDRSHRVVDP